MHRKSCLAGQSSGRFCPAGFGFGDAEGCGAWLAGHARYGCGGTKSQDLGAIKGKSTNVKIRVECKSLVSLSKLDPGAIRS
eukprot:Skav220474  [mRNA]  locus=scaffold591:10558:10800:+ [translate_table: standard]